VAHCAVPDSTDHQPGIQAAGFRVNSAKEGIAIAKSAYYPTLSVFANLNSSYSSRFLDFQNGTIATGYHSCRQLSGERTAAQYTGCK
jgi:outer membrane protein TolC